MAFISARPAKHKVRLMALTVSSPKAATDFTHCLAVDLISLAILVPTLLLDRHTDVMSNVSSSPLVRKRKSRLAR